MADPVTSTSLSSPGGYDAAGNNGNRKAAGTILKSEDRVLGQVDRKRAISAGRDIRRNFPDAAWAIRKHLDFVSSFTFQARTSDAGFNRDLDAWVQAVSLAEAFDASGRMRADRFFRLLEAHRCVDGDVGAMKLADGHVQGIEGDRIASAPATRDAPPWYAPDQFTHGILTSRGGAHQYYALCDRTPGGGFALASVLPAKALFWYGFYDRFDQVRGISPVMASLNPWRDVYEARTYALLKAKVAQLFGLKITSGANSSPSTEPIGRVTGVEETTDLVAADSAGNDAGKYEVDFGKGALLLDLTSDPGHDAEFLENRTPSQEFQNFDQAVIASALKGLDIPLSFYDESFTNFYGSKGALQHYLFSANQKRLDHRELRDRWFQWRLGVAVLAGEIVLPRSVAFDDVDWEWIPTGLPWWKPLEEVRAQQESIKLGTLSVPDACRERGDDALEIARRQIAWEVTVGQMREAAGLPALQFFAPEPGQPDPRADDPNRSDT